jgi:hypothetical protein
MLLCESNQRDHPVWSGCLGSISAIVDASWVEVESGGDEIDTRK